MASIYRLAQAENLVAVDPCARIGRPEVHRELQRREVITVLEYAAFLTGARSLSPTHHAIAVLGGMLGLRASEMAGLTVDSLSTVRGYVTLTFIGKGDKPARVPVPLPALPAVQAATDGAAPAGRCYAPAPARAWTAARCTATSPAPPRRLGSAGPSARTRCAEPLARLDSIRASRCVTSSDSCATLARRPLWPVMTSPATPSNGTPPTRSPASSPAEPKGNVGIPLPSLHGPRDMRQAFRAASGARRWPLRRSEQSESGVAPCEL